MGIWETRRWSLTGRVSPQVKVPMKFNGSSGVQLRTPRDLTNLASYTALKFYLQSPEPTAGQVVGDQFVLYMGGRQVAGWLCGLGGAGCQAGVGGVPEALAPLILLSPRPPVTTWVWLCGARGCTGFTASAGQGLRPSALTRTLGSSSRPSALTGRTPSPHSTPQPASVAACPHLTSHLCPQDPPVWPHVCDGGESDGPGDQGRHSGPWG